MFLAALDQSIVEHRDPHDRRRPERAVGAGVGHHGVPDHRDDHHADLRQARRHVRPQEAVPVRHRGVHPRLGGLLVRHLDVLARGVPGASRASAPAVCSPWSWRSSATSSSPRERARYTGYFMAVFGTSSVLGPVIGGLLRRQADSILGITGWRWVFLVNVPDRHRRARRRLPHAAPAPPRRRPARIDWWGRRGLVVALVPLLIVAEQGRGWGWDLERLPAAATSCGLIGMVAFVLIERAMGDGRADPAAHLPDPRGRGRHRGERDHRDGDVRRHHRCCPQYMQIVHGASPTECPAS